MRLSEKTFEPVDCALCGPSRTRLIANTGQFGWPTYVSICKQCGLVYLNPRWTKSDYEEFYSVEYDQFYRFNEAEAAAKEQRKAKVVWERLNQFAGGKFTTALDIGCGLGWCLHTIAGQVPGLAIAGIEPSDYCADHFVTKIGGKLIARDVDSDWHLSHQGEYDLITFRHVLEHLLDPVAVLKKVREALSPQGVVYIAVPDMMHPDGSLAEFWYRCVHTYYYSEVTLARLAARAGLKPYVIQTENSELWGIFQRGENVEEATLSIYTAQLAAVRQYKRKRFARRIMLSFSPQKLSPLVPGPVKKMIPKEYKDRFRRLVYRH